MKDLQKLAHLGLRMWLRFYHGHRVGKAERLRLDRPTLLIANHSSHIDIAAICAALPLDEIPRIRVAAARDHVFRFPFPLICLTKFLFNVFPFERKNGSADSLQKCADYLKKGCHVVIFPEGRRSPDGTFLGFTPGFASVAYKTGAPVVPIRIDGAHKALPRGTIVPLPCPLFVEIRPSLHADVSIPWSDRRRAYEKLTKEAEQSVAA